MQLGGADHLYRPGDPTKGVIVTDRVVLVTGASSGIGFATAERFVALGDTVVGVDARAGVPDGVEFIACDVTDADAVTATVAAAVEPHGRLDVLANVAGIAQFGHFADLDAATWKRVLDVNLNGPFHMISAALPYLSIARGNVVNVASVAGVKGQAYTAAYCASKGGLVMLTKSLAVELSTIGVRVNCVCPGAVETPIVTEVASLIPADADPRLLARLMGLLPGITQPGEVADAIVYLASESAAMITGTALVIDGGQST